LLLGEEREPLAPSMGGASSSDPDLGKIWTRKLMASTVAKWEFGTTDWNQSSLLRYRVRALCVICRAALKQQSEARVQVSRPSVGRLEQQL